MATLYEYLNTGSNSTGAIWGANWMAQSFTPQIGHDISFVKLKLYRIGSPGTLTVGVRATSSTFPTGADLAVGTFDTSTLTLDSSGLWYTITFAASYTLTVSVMYALVVRATAGADADNAVRWRLDTSTSYTRGNWGNSSDSGGTWTTAPLALADFMFEEWSDEGYAFTQAHVIG